MPSIRITSFAGVNNEISPRLAPNNVAQIAHNCLLWDGSLRPLAKWTKLLGYDLEGAQSIALSPDNSIIQTSTLKDAAFLRGHMYAAGTKLGLLSIHYSTLDSNIVYANGYTTAEGEGVGVHRPELNVETTTISYTRGYYSDKPVNRMYAISAVRDNGFGVEESALTVLPNQSPQSIIYEGDLASLAIHVISQIPYQWDGFRLYRSISGMDTGSSVGNELDTDWYLIDDLRGGTADGINYAYAYVDGGSATTDPLDLYLAGNFYPPRRYVYDHLQQLESGWIAAATRDGEISVSERYLYHAWPSENFFDINESVTDFKAQADTIFIGTEHAPYLMAVSSGEKLGVQVQIKPFPEAYKCLPNTMDKTPSGAIYASPQGIVSLSREGMRLLSQGVTSGVAPLYKFTHTYEELTVDGPVERTKAYPMRYQHTYYGAYVKGYYFGFCRVQTNQLDEFELPLYLSAGYIFSTSSELDGQRPLQKFVTMDIPVDVRYHAVGGSGLHVLAADGIYRMPFPDSEGDERYTKSPKYCYDWKSKKFVFPGEMVMAACKVVHDCKGFVRIKFFVDCCCVYETLVRDCQPFTLPPDMVGVEWEIQLQGTAAVHEVHVASSLRELIEHE